MSAAQAIAGPGAGSRTCVSEEQPPVSLCQPQLSAIESLRYCNAAQSLPEWRVTYPSLIDATVQVPCGNQFELLGRQVYLAVSNKCPQDMAGKPRQVDPQGPPGITLHTSDDGGSDFKAACLPVALRVGGWPSCSHSALRLLQSLQSTKAATAHELWHTSLGFCTFACGPQNPTGKFRCTIVASTQLLLHMMLHSFLCTTC